MDNKKEQIRQNLQKRLDEAVPGLEVFSEAHHDSIEKFGRLLEKMKEEQKSGTEKVALMQLQNLVDSLTSYLDKHGFMMTDAETRELTVITGSGFDIPVKKRMAEDLIHKIKNRCEKDRRRKISEENRRSEIEELRRSGPGIMGWIRLTLFGMEYGTITPVSHRLKNSTVLFLKNQVNDWFSSVERAVREVLDSEYYIFSNLEYNVLQKLLELRESLDAIQTMPYRASYSSEEISRQMDSFSSVYISLVMNSEAIEKAFKKVLAKLKKQHGLWGSLKSLLDEPIHNNRPVTITGADRISRTILGVLLSYYTVREKVLVQTFNQVMYLSGTDGIIESGRKKLSNEAVRIEKETREKKNTEKKIMVDSFRALERIIEYFLPMGASAEKMIMKVELSGQYERALEEHRTNPLLRMKRLLELFIRYFIEDIRMGSEFILNYDGEDFRNYFSIRPEITEIAEKFSLMEFGLTGSKLKDFLSIGDNSGIMSDVIMDILVSPDAEITEPRPGFSWGRSVIGLISERSYSLAGRLGELISHYYNNKEIISDNTIYNYDFFAGARLYSSKMIKSPSAFKRGSISLKEFLETACSLAFHIASELGHPGIEAMRREQNSVKEKLGRLMSGDDIAIEPVPEGYLPDPEDNERVVEELNRVFVDTLTGLKRKEYYEEVILRQQYDEEGRYNEDISRFIFMCEIFGLKELNQLYGHTIGDEIVLAVVNRINEHVRFHGSHRNNAVIRYGGTVYMGFLHSITLTEAVDHVRDMVRGINRIIIERDGNPIGQIKVAAAVYEERKNTAHETNLQTVRSIISRIHQEGHGRMGFIKKADYIVTLRDFDSRGNINEEIITFVE